MPTIQELVQELEQEAPTTRRVLERIPADRLDWRPHPKSTSLGELAHHVAQLPRGILEISARPTFDVSQGAPRPESVDVEELLATFDASVAHALTALRAMSDADLATPWRVMHGERELLAITRGALLRTILLNHWYHHRGQLTVYLRLNEVPLPAVYGPSADEQPFGI